MSGPDGVLYIVPGYHRNLPCLLAGAFSDIQLEVKEGKPKACKSSSNDCSEACLSSLFPNAPVFVPATHEKDGSLLCDPSAIAFRVSSAQLKGVSTNQMDQVLQWVVMSERDILPIVEILAFTSGLPPTEGSCSTAQDPISQCAFSKAQSEISPLLAALDSYLRQRTFFVGERITLADVFIFSALYVLFKLKCAKPLASEHKHLLRWFNTVLNQPEVSSIQTPYSMFAVDGPLCSNSFVMKTTSTVNASPVEAAKSSQANDDIPEEPKAKNPLAALPKGTFSLDDFKRAYCNQDTETVAIPFLWEHFDAEHYSFWLSDYEYSDELKMMFMTSNLVSGMFQRLDSMRNHAFASVCIFGQDFKNTISGVWLWRGQELAFPLCPDWSVDYESYKWQKLDASKEEVREMINGYLLWKPPNVSGLEFADGKIFK